MITATKLLEVGGPFLIQKLEMDQGEIQWGEYWIEETNLLLFKNTTIRVKTTSDNIAIYI